MKSVPTMVAMTLATLLACALGTPAAHAQSTKAELQQRFRDRYPELQKLRAAGKVGETNAGTVEAVKGGLDKAAQKLVDQENADRAELYQLLAKETGATSEKVARIDGARRIKALHAGEYYKDDEGWHQKG